jgi:mono/diheme cytochrome c family protein
MSNMNKDQRDKAVYAREHTEPVERNNPVPWLLGLVSASLCVWGVSYFLLNPNLAPAAAPPSQSAAVSPSQSAANAPPAAAPVVADGAQIFSSRCASCHQPTGAGLPGVFPPLAGSEFANGDASTLASILLLGIKGAVTVKGTTYNGLMPPFGQQLSDAEIAAVASYVRASFGNKSPPLTAEVVKAERAKLGNRSTPLAGAAELEAQR